MQRTQFRSLDQEDPWRRKWQPTSVFLPGKSHGQRNLVAYGPGVARVGQNLVTKLPPNSQGCGVMKIITVMYVPRRCNCCFCCSCCLFSCYIVSKSFATPWTLGHQASLCMGFPRQEYWSGLPFPSLGGSSQLRN